MWGWFAASKQPNRYGKWVKGETSAIKYVRPSADSDLFKVYIRPNFLEAYQYVSFHFFFNFICSSLQFFIN